LALAALSAAISRGISNQIGFRLEPDSQCSEALKKSQAAIGIIWRPWFRSYS
jgi:hypothetical protein